MRTELYEKFKETTNIEGYVRDELSILPIRLDCDPDVNGICDSSGSRHFLLSILHETKPNKIKKKEKE